MYGGRNACCRCRHNRSSLSTSLLLALLYRAQRASPVVAARNNARMGIRQNPLLPTMVHSKPGRLSGDRPARHSINPSRSFTIHSVASETAPTSANPTPLTSMASTPDHSVLERFREFIQEAKHLDLRDLEDTIKFYAVHIAGSAENMERLEADDFDNLFKVLLTSARHWISQNSQTPVFKRPELSFHSEDSWSSFTAAVARESNVRSNSACQAPKSSKYLLHSSIPSFYNDSARRLFRDMELCEIVPWRSTILACFELVRLTSLEDALSLVRRCQNLADCARRKLRYADRTLFIDEQIYSQLIQGLAKIGDVDGAVKLFNLMTGKDESDRREESKKDVSVKPTSKGSWSAEILGLFNCVSEGRVFETADSPSFDSQDPQHSDRLNEFRAVPRRGTFSMLIDILVSYGRFEQAVDLAKYMVTEHSILPDRKVLNALFLGLSRTSLVTEEMWNCFRALNIPETPDCLDSFSFDVMMKFLISIGDSEGSLNVFNMIGTPGQFSNIIPSQHTLNIGLDAKCRTGKLVEALDQLEEMRQAKSADIVSFNTVLSELGRRGLADDANEVFSWMNQADQKPDEITYTNIIIANFRAHRPETALKWFSAMKDAGLTPTVVTVTCLLDGITKSGNTKMARAVQRTVANSLLTKEGPKNLEKVVLSDQRLLSWFGEHISNRRIWRPDRVFLTALLYGLTKTRDETPTTDALLSTMRRGLRDADMPMYNAILKAIIRRGLNQSAFDLLETMLRNRQNLDSYTISVLVSGLVRAGDFPTAESVMISLLDSPDAPPITVHPYSSLIRGYGADGNLWGLVRWFEAAVGSPVITSSVEAREELYQIAGPQDIKQIICAPADRSPTLDPTLYNRAVGGLVRRRALQCANLVVRDMVSRFPERPVGAQGRVWSRTISIVMEERRLYRLMKRARRKKHKEVNR
ncbi:hypothetical protein DFJ73DRAFT_811739 [Zopfochytrium polystomum]|nr:hypothetical protein DFJ73DRAFT_811739 [Zopfochytrium polystomum]